MSRVRRTLSAAAAVIMTFASAAVTAPAATAAKGPSPAAEAAVTWAVRPSDGTAADGRTRVDLELAAGEAATEHLIVTNLSDVAARFTLSSADGYYTASGRFNMLPVDESSTDAGTWISLADPTVELAPGASAVVPFEVVVPANATPGDHPAGVAASLRTTATASDGSMLGVDSRVGFRVMTRVTGELAPSLALSDVEADYDPSWNPFAPGEIAVTYALEDSGNTALTATTRARAGTSSAMSEAELFPGDRRQVQTRITEVWPLVFAVVRVDADARATPEGGTTAASAEVFVWTAPWSQLVVILGVVLLTLAAIAGRRRHVAGIERLVAEARREGAQAAATVGSERS